MSFWCTWLRASHYVFVTILVLLLDHRLGQVAQFESFTLYMITHRPNYPAKTIILVLLTMPFVADVCSAACPCYTNSFSYCGVAFSRPALKQWVGPGGSSTVSITAAGDTGSEYYYRWEKNGVPLPQGPACSEYTFTTQETLSYNVTTNAVPSVAGKYGLRVCHKVGSTPIPFGEHCRSEVEVIYTLAPVIVQQPASHISLYPPTGFSFSTKVVGHAPYSFQWRKNGTNISGGSVVQTNDIATFTFSKTVSSAADAGIYTLVVSNSDGAATTMPVNLVMPSVDIPTLPGWGVLIMVVLLVIGAARELVRPGRC